MSVDESLAKPSLLPDFGPETAEPSAEQPNLAATLQSCDFQEDRPRCGEQDVPPVSSRQRAHRGLWRMAAGAALFVPPAIGLATAVSVAETPTHLTIAPGFAVDAGLRFGSYMTADYGPTQLDLPALHKVLQMRIAGHAYRVPTSADIRIAQMSTQGEIIDDAAAIKDQPDVLQKPVESAISRRAWEGLGAGSLVTAVGEAALVAGRRRWRRSRRSKQALDHVAALLEHQPGEVSPQIAEVLAEAGLLQTPDGAAAESSRFNDYHHRIARLSKPLAALALSTAIIVGGSAYTYDKTAGQAHVTTADATPLDPYCADQSPILAGASVSSDIGAALNAACKKLNWYVDKTTADWQGYSLQAEKQVAKLQAMGAMEWLNDPNIVAFMDITDTHGSMPAMEYLIPELARLFRITIITDTGDQYNVGGTSVLDRAAFSTLLKYLTPQMQDGRSIHIYFSKGNHDPAKLPAAIANTTYAADGQSWHPVTMLDASNHFTAHDQGITFVGAADRNQTNFAGTFPPSIDGQLKNDALAGEELAKAACDAKAAGDQSIVALAHEPQMAYATLVSGCADVTESGHWHINEPNQTYRNPDGSLSVQQILGPAGGAGPSDYTTVEGSPTTTGGIRINLFDVTTGDLQQSILVTYGPSAQLQIQLEGVPAVAKPAKASHVPDISSFMKSYDPDFLHKTLPALQSQADSAKHNTKTSGLR